MKNFTKILISITAFLSLASNIKAQTTILSTDFESALPAGWTTSTYASDGGWLFGTNTDLKSNAFPIPAHTKMAATNDDKCNCNKSADFLITSAIDLSSYSNVFMSFDSYFYRAYYDSQEETYVKVSTDGGLNWTIVYSLPGSVAWNQVDVNLSAYAGISNVMIALHYDDGGGWGYGSAVDNIKVYAPVPGTDITVSSVVVGKIDPTPAFVGYTTYIAGAPLTVSSVVYNKGTETINSFDVSWTDGINSYNQSYTGLNIEALKSYAITAADPYLTLSGDHNITLTVSNVNGGVTEIDANNNSGSFGVEGVVLNKDKKYLAEEATGTWCGWCVRGIVFMDYMAELYPDQFVGVAVHNGDPMANTTYDNGVGGFPGFQGYPSVIINRSYIIDPSQLEADFISSCTQAPKVILSADAELNPNTNVLTITAKGEFLESLSGDYRFNAVIIEDSVHGTTSGYKQANYYSGGGNGLMGGFESLGSSIPAASMYYNHVGRSILGGFNGASGSLPASINAGETHSYTFTYNVPTTVNINQMHVAVMVLKNNGVALNANTTDWKFVTGVNELQANASVFIYPNPANETAKIDIKLANTNPVHVQVINLLGQVVYAAHYSSLSEHQLLSIPTKELNNGLYSIRIDVAGQSIIKPLMVSH